MYDEIATLYHLIYRDWNAVIVQQATALEAAERNLAIDFPVADLRRCAEVHGSGFDVVLSADNSIPHLLRRRGTG